MAKALTGGCGFRELVERTLQVLGDLTLAEQVGDESSQSPDRYLLALELDESAVPVRVQTDDEMRVFGNLLRPLAGQAFLDMSPSEFPRVRSAKLNHFDSSADRRSASRDVPERRPRAAVSGPVCRSLRPPSHLRADKIVRTNGSFCTTFLAPEESR